MSLPQIVLFVQFNDKGTERHTAFENARERMKTHPKGVYVGAAAVVNAATK